VGKRGDEMRLRILPTLRERRRYIKFQVLSAKPVHYVTIKETLQNTLKEFIGELGLSKASFRLMRELYDTDAQVGVLRCNHHALHAVIASLSLVSQIKATPVIFKVLKVSGTIRGVKD
jgi:RNase P/RNase MRP subunit POP5